MTEEKAPETAEAPEPAPVSTAESAKEQDQVEMPEPARPAAEQRRSWSGLVAAGLLATTAAGFALAWFDPLHWRGDNPIPALEARIEALAARLEEAQAGRDGLVARIEALEAAPQVAAADLTDLGTRVKAVESTLAGLESATADSDGSISVASFAALQATVQALKADLAGLAAAPGSVPDSAVRAAVDQAMADWAATEAARVQAEVEAAQAAARRAAAVEMILAAAQTGVPYAEALASLDTTDVPAVLRDHAAGGLPTLALLEGTFTEAARAALDAALRETGAEGLADGFLAFLRVQTGARSLEPREGTDPDAVLSRAEAAVKAGDVTAALQELAGLPEQGRAAMADWTAQAQVYLAAQEALAGLSALPVQE
jgi:hypothetical protein